MELKITTRKTTVTKGIKEAIESRLSFLNKYLKEGTPISVTIEVVSSFEQKIDVLLTYNRTLIKADAVDKDLYVSIDLVAEKVEKQLLKQIDIDKTIKNSRPEFGQDIHEVIDTTDSTELIIKRKRFNMKPMSEDEAILQMQALKHDTFMFFHSSLEVMCLLYKKKNSKYGLIEGLLEE